MKFLKPVSLVLLYYKHRISNMSSLAITLMMIYEATSVKLLPLSFLGPKKITSFIVDVRNAHYKVCC